MNINTLCRQNDVDFNYIEVVAFDIFDTIISRRVSPEQVCHMWADKVIKRYKLDCTVEKLIRLRNRYARYDKLVNYLSGKDKEYTYRNMCRMINRAFKLENNDDDFYKTSINIEIENEKAIGYVNDEIRELIETSKSCKRVICVSDFYLPKFAVKDILSSFKIYVDDIFVSGECLLQKRSGRLYKYVVDIIGCKTDKILMIGDTAASDYEKAEQAGLHAILVDSNKQKEYYSEYEKERYQNMDEFWKYINNAGSKKSHIPFSDVSYLMAIFIRRLYIKLKQDECRDILFMSREGEFFKKLFDTYQEACIDKSDRIKTYYFYASRRATLIPSIHDIKKESFKEIYKNYPNISIMTFLKNIGLDCNEKILNEFKYMLEDDKPIEKFESSCEYKTILNSKIFQNECLKNAEEQRNMFIGYLDDMGIDYKRNGLYIADIGYSGTSQNNIYRIFKGDVKIHGYYMISYANYDGNDENSKTGIIYDIRDGKKKNYFTYDSSVIEMLCLASHGSVDGYKERNGKIVPIFNNNNEELQCYRDTIVKLQNSILEECTKILCLIDRSGIDENSYYKVFMNRYRRFIFNPTKEEMEEYLKIPFVDNFAIYRTYKSDETMHLGKCFDIGSFIKLIRTRGRCLKDQNTHWMAAALYKLNMRCLNYVFYIFADAVMTGFDYMLRKEKLKRHVNKKEI